MSGFIDDTASTPLLKTHVAASLEHETDSGSGSGWGEVEDRQRLEKELVWKVDKRMSVLVLIYILNYVRIFHLCTLIFSKDLIRVCCTD